MNTPPRWLKTKQAAEYLGHCENWLVIGRSTGSVQIPHYRFGGSVKYLESDVLEYIAANKVEPEPAEAR
jgi:predicted DNA-binding transcriptional regulator AlpA